MDSGAAGSCGSPSSCIVANMADQPVQITQHGHDPESVPAGESTTGIGMERGVTRSSKRAAGGQEESARTRCTRTEDRWPLSNVEPLSPFESSSLRGHAWSPVAPAASWIFANKAICAAHAWRVRLPSPAHAGDDARGGHAGQPRDSVDAGRSDRRCDSLRPLQNT